MIIEPKYDLILQNNASREFFSYSGLTDISTNHLFYHFDMEPEVPDGEYTYLVVMNYRDDAEYELKTPLLSSIIHTQDGDVVVRDLQPATGLLQIGSGLTTPDNIYDESEDNNTIFYYDN